MLVSSLHCGGHVKWTGVLLEVVWFLILLGCWDQASFTCVLALLLCLAISCSLPSLPFLVSVRYNVSFPVPLFFFFSVWWCQVVAACRVVMVSLRAQLLCLWLHYLSRYTFSKLICCWFKLNTAMPTKVMTSMVVSLTHVQEHHSSL